MRQKDLAEKLYVSPQYINKLIHGQDLNLKIATALRYGRILGVKLVEIPKDERTESQVTINYFQMTTRINSSRNDCFIYTKSNFLKRVITNC